MSLRPKRGFRRLADIDNEARHSCEVLERFLKAHSIQYQRLYGDGFIRYFVQRSDLCCAQSVLSALWHMEHGGPDVV